MQHPRQTANPVLLLLLLPPLPPPSLPVPPGRQVREVLDTCRTAARLGSGSLGAYVISMSQAASDVLAVELLQKEARLMVCGCLAGWLGGQVAG